MNNRTYQKLIVWQRAHALVINVYKITEKFPKTEQFGLISQMRRAAISVVANIVEGQSRNSNKDFLHFLNISEGSLVELEYYFDLSLDLKFISQEEFNIIDKLRGEVGFLLHQLVIGIKQKHL